MKTGVLIYKEMFSLAKYAYEQALYHMKVLNSQIILKLLNFSTSLSLVSLPNTGQCDGTNYFPPRCVNCSLSMGEACDRPCVHGTETEPFSNICECDPCYSDPGCQTECSAHGSCNNATCLCDVGFKGDNCELLDCPGEYCFLVLCVPHGA